MTQDEWKRMEAVVEMTVSKLDIKFTQILGDIRLDIANSINDKITSCSEKHDSKTRWNIGTWISIVVAGTALAGVIISNIRG